MTKKEVNEWIAERLENVQSNFDLTKGTFLTAGLIVAVTISQELLKEVKIFGIPSIKYILSFTILSMLFMVFSFVVAEFHAKRLDRINYQVAESKSFRLNLIETILTFRVRKIDKEMKVLRFYGYPINYIIAALNNVATLFLVLALSSFLYSVIATNL